VLFRSCWLTSSPLMFRVASRACTPMLRMPPAQLNLSRCQALQRSFCTGPEPKTPFFSPMRVSFWLFTAGLGVAFYKITGLHTPGGKSFWDTSHKQPSDAALKAQRQSEKEQIVMVEREKAGVQDQPLYFLDVSVAGARPARLVLELFFDTTPLTAQNFHAMCTSNQASLHLKGSAFHRIIPGFMIQGGDVTRGDGTGGMSIYGRTFPDENFVKKHSEAGMLSMANCGPNTNSSQFFITLAPCPHLDGKHVVFGRVVKGMQTLDVIAEQGTAKGRTKATVTIVDCGILPSSVKKVKAASGKLKDAPSEMAGSPPRTRVTAT